MNWNKKILIVEDDIATANDLEDILESNGFDVVGLAFTGAQAIELIKSKQPEFVLLDISLKGEMTGLDVAKYINLNFKIPFVFLTAFSDGDTVSEVVKTNPGGYLVKPFKESEIVPAILVAVANNEKKNDGIFPSLEDINYRIPTPLTSHEYKVLKLVWAGIKNEEVAARLFVSVNTVKTHLRKLYSKLDVNTRSAALNKVFTYK